MELLQAITDTFGAPSSGYSLDTTRQTSAWMGADSLFADVFGSEKSTEGLQRLKQRENFFRFVTTPAEIALSWIVLLGGVFAALLKDGSIAGDETRITLGMMAVLAAKIGLYRLINPRGWGRLKT